MLGLLIVIIGVGDILYTVLSPSGAGYCSGKCVHWIWKLSIMIAGHDGKKKFLPHIGIFAMLFIVLMWVAMLWIGNTVALYADDGALLNSNQDGHQKDFVSKLYYISYVLSAMGHGDYSPATDFWKCYTAVVSFTGVIFISLAVSYILPVLDAVTNKRSIAIRIWTLGATPNEILERRLNNESCKGLVEDLLDLNASLIELAQQHLAYPIIHYFHSTKHHESTALAIAKLDEVVSTLEYLLIEVNTELHLLDNLYKVRTALTYYINTLHSAYINPNDHQPSLPIFNITNMYEGHLSSKNAKFEEHFNRLSDRRRLLVAYVINDGWSWETLTDCDSTINILKK